MKNRIVVGAHYGLKDWLAQRITAIVMAVYALFMSLAFLDGAGSSYQSWHALMSNPFVRFFSLIFILSLAYHAWVGVRDCWMDYVKPTTVRLTLHVLTILALVCYAGWSVQILWRLN